MFCFVSVSDFVFLDKLVFCGFTGLLDFGLGIWCLGLYKTEF